MFRHPIRCRQIISLALLGQLIIPSQLFAQEQLSDPAPPQLTETSEEIFLSTEITSNQEVEIPISSWTEYPRMCAGSGYQRDLKSGDTLVIYAESANPQDFSADLSEISIPEPQSFLATENPNLYRLSVLIPDAISSGTKNIYVVGEDGAAEIQVSIDNLLPEVTLNWSSGTNGRIVQYIDAYISGTINDNLSDPIILDTVRIPYTLEGARTESPYIFGGIPQQLATQRAGSFSDIPIYIAEFDPSAKRAVIELSVADRACNITRAVTEAIPYYNHGEEPPPQLTASSSVLFLPGIKGSKLFTDTGEQLWIPGINDDDIEELYLDQDGHSIRSDIYVPQGLGGILLSAAGTDFYASFADEMNSLVSSGSINEWAVAGYDWRLSISDIVSNGVLRDGRIYYGETSQDPYIISTLRDLASRSATGKVSIVAHSNGGLVSKVLIDTLGDEANSLIDKVIFVGVPQTGAPQALGALLLGYGEAIPRKKLPLMVSEEDARHFALNSPMGYHLLPSQAYFDNRDQGAQNVVEFSGSDYSKEIQAYGNEIDAWWELKNFILANEGGREKPKSGDLKTPEIGNESLLLYADALHKEIDSWQPPEGVELYSLAGVGERTIMGIEFYEFDFPGFAATRLYRPTFSRNGDGVVPDISAADSNNPGDERWIDLNRLEQDSIDHGTLLQSSEILSFIGDTIIGKKDGVYNNIHSELFEPSDEGFMEFFLHSPANILITDQEGRRLGIDEYGEEQSEISTGRFGEFGEVKYVFVPKDGIYTATVIGTGEGKYTFEIRDSLTKRIATYAQIPVSRGDHAEVTLTDGTIASSLKISASNKLVDGKTVFSDFGEIRSIDPDSLEQSSRASKSVSKINTEQKIAQAQTTIGIGVHADQSNQGAVNILDIRKHEHDEGSDVLGISSDTITYVEATQHPKISFSEKLKLMLFSIWRWISDLLRVFQSTIQV